MELGGEDIAAADGANVGLVAVGGGCDCPAVGFELAGDIRGEVAMDVVVLAGFAKAVEALPCAVRFGVVVKCAC